MKSTASYQHSSLLRMHGVKCTKSRPSRSFTVIVHARGPSRRNGPGGNRPPPGVPKRPDSGFFADVDPKAEIYPVRSSLQQDPTKRGGRWQSDFIWNQNWKEALDFEEDVRRQVEQGRQEKLQNQVENRKLIDGTLVDTTNNTNKGFLSLTSKVDLNSMDVDLSAQLRPRKPKNETITANITASSSSSSSNSLNLNGLRSSSASMRGGGYPANPATRGEVRSWDRSGRYSRKVVATPSSTADAEEMAAKQAAEQARYDELKKELQRWAIALTAVCLGATYVFYGRDSAASYGVGALGGLFYLRLLNKSVDGIGAGGIGAALGQNRLLIPVILALGYNRYNTMLSESTGLTLQLLPILTGFFTYKGAVIAKQSLALFEELSASSRGGGDQIDGFDGLDGEQRVDDGVENDSDRIDVKSVDRAFNKRMLSG